MDYLWTFEIAKDLTGTLRIQDQLLNTSTKAKERAMSEMLKNSYTMAGFSFKTYLTDLSINDIVKIKGVNYLVKNISTGIGKEMISEIGVIRYD